MNPSSPYRRPYIFLVGCPRSGTTLLQRMLNAHPDVAIAPETKFMRRFWSRRAVYGPLHREANFERLLHDITHTPEFQEMHLDPVRFREEAEVGLRTYPVLFGLWLDQFARLQNVQVVGEKTPDHLMHMAALQAFFAGACFIHIVRDPRAVVNSLRTVPWSKGTLAEDAEVWRGKLAHARRAGSRMGAALHTVRFEQLIAEPESSLAAICRFLGLPYAPCMLDYHRQPPGTVNIAREPWKHNVVRPPDQEAQDRWRQELTPAMVAQIEAVVLFEMKRWNYPVETKRLLLRSLLHVLWRMARRLKNRVLTVRRRLIGPKRSLGLASAKN